MRNPLRPVLDHITTGILVGTLGPGVIHAIYEFYQSGGEVGVDSIWIAATSGSITAACLLALKVRELSQALEQSEHSRQSRNLDPPVVVNLHSTESIEHERAPTNEPIEVVRYVPDTLDREKLWCPRTVDELRAILGGKTSAQQKTILQDYADMWLHVDGTVTNASRGDFDNQVRATISSTGGTPCMVSPGSENCGRILVASNVGDAVSIQGQIKYSEFSGNLILLENCELA